VNIKTETRQLEDNLFLTLKKDGLYFHTKKALYHSKNGANFFGSEYVNRINSKSVINKENITPEVLKYYEEAFTPFQYKMTKKQ
jgi:hypothetical protein|tara:strand:+ start:1509 stop:1760 length:252 start_codon:yes stop_codon:yes gene_type:complete